MLSALGELAIGTLLTWSGGFVNYFPTTGWDVYASTQEVVTMVLLAGLFGLLLPLEVAAVTKAPSAAGTAGGLFGTIFGVLSTSCCAPLILPVLLSFVGFRMTLLQPNITVHESVTPLTIVSIGIMLLAIALVSRTITAVCEVPSRIGRPTRAVSGLMGSSRVAPPTQRRGRAMVVSSAQGLRRKSAPQREKPHVLSICRADGAVRHSA